VRARTFLIAVILLAILLLLNLPLPAALRVKGGMRDNLRPYRNVMSFVLRGARLLGGALADANVAREERRQLLEEVSTLRYKLHRMAALERENDELRRQLGFAARAKHKLVLCEVVSRGGSTGWWHSIRLNKGSEDGIVPNAAVMTMDGLVGRTGTPDGADGKLALTLSRETCDVLLITDPNCRVACKFSRTGALGILRGAGASVKGEGRLEMLFAPEPCTVQYIDKGAAVRAGDEVVTSGLGGVYPAGIIVGRVVEVRVDSSGLYQRARVAPAAALAALGHVFVVAEQ
jgi:rod shape-determining protein MreC